MWRRARFQRRGSRSLLGRPQPVGGDSLSPALRWMRGVGFVFSLFSRQHSVGSFLTARLRPLVLCLHFSPPLAIGRGWGRGARALAPGVGADIPMRCLEEAGRPGGSPFRSLALVSGRGGGEPFRKGQAVRMPRKATWSLSPQLRSAWDPGSGHRCCVNQHACPCSGETGWTLTFKFD